MQMVPVILSNNPFVYRILESGTLGFSSRPLKQISRLIFAAGL